MATMTAEYIDVDPYSIAVPQSEREWLMDNGTVPPGWRIWIGNYQRHKWISRWSHFTFPMLDARDVPTSDHSEPPLPNTQVTTFTVGRLYVHVMSSVHADTVAKWYWGLGPAPIEGRLLAQIFPHKESIIAWPPQSLSDQSADGIAGAFKRYTDAISLSLLGPQALLASMRPHSQSQQRTAQFLRDAKSGLILSKANMPRQQE
jgi:hypothetical protein